MSAESASPSENLQSKSKEIVANRNQFPKTIPLMDDFSNIDPRSYENFGGSRPVVIGLEDEVPAVLDDLLNSPNDLRLKKHDDSTLSLEGGLSDRGVLIRPEYLKFDKTVDIGRTAIGFKTSNGEVAYFITKSGDDKEVSLVRDDLFKGELEFTFGKDDLLEFKFAKGRQLIYQEYRENVVLINHPSFNPDNLGIYTKGKELRIINKVFEGREGQGMKILIQRKGAENDLIKVEENQDTKLEPDDLIVFENVPVGIRVRGESKREGLRKLTEFQITSESLANGFPPELKVDPFWESELPVVSPVSAADNIDDIFDKVLGKEVELVTPVPEKLNQVNWNFSMKEFLGKEGVKNTINEIGKFYKTSIKPRGWKDAVMIAARLAVAPKGVSGMILGGLLMTVNLGGIAIKEAKTLKKISEELGENKTTGKIWQNYWDQTSYGKLLVSDSESSSNLDEVDRLGALACGMIGALVTTVATEVAANYLPATAVTRSLIYRGLAAYIMPSVLGLVEKKFIGKAEGWDKTGGDEWLASSMAVMSTTLTAAMTMTTLADISNTLLEKLFSQQVSEQPVESTITATKEMVTETVKATNTLESSTNTPGPTLTQTATATVTQTATATATPTAQPTEMPTVEPIPQSTIIPENTPPETPVIPSPSVETPPVQPQAEILLGTQTINGHEFQVFDTGSDKIADKWVDNAGQTLVDAGNGFIKSVDAEGNAEAYFIPEKVIGSDTVQIGIDPSAVDLNGDGQADLEVKNNQYFLDDKPVDVSFRWNEKADKQIIDVMEFQDGSMWKFSHNNLSGEPQYMGVLDDGRILNMHSEGMPIAMLQKGLYDKYGKLYSPQEVGGEAFNFWKDHKEVDYSENEIINRVNEIPITNQSLPDILVGPSTPEVKQTESFGDLALDAKGGPVGELQGIIHQANPDLSINEVSQIAQTTYVNNQDEISNRVIQNLDWSEAKLNHEINEGMAYRAVFNKFVNLNTERGWGIDRNILAQSVYPLLERWNEKIPSNQIFHGTGSQPQYNQLLANIMDKDDEDEWNIFFEGFLKQIGVIK